MGVGLILCAFLSVAAVLMIRTKKNRNVKFVMQNSVNDDTDELPDLSLYGLQCGEFKVEEDITLVHANRSTN